MAEEKRIPHFDISAAVIRQLGEELVTDEVTAIMELIKNSYDADADWVKVEINTKDVLAISNLYYNGERPGYIIIEDNGFGMSDDDIWNSWMKISLSAKKKFKEQELVTPKGRTPLGEKGVGRLSSQKLGNRLELLTGKADSTVQNHVAFDWDDFQDDLSLTSVPVYLNQIEKKPAEKGTKLILTNLREPRKWEGSSWDLFRGQISKMVFPYKERRPFNVFLRLNGKNVDLDELTEKLIENSVSKYSFELQEENLIIEGKVKFQRLSGSNSPDARDFYEGQIISDYGRDFFDFLTDSKNNKSYFLSDVNYSGEGGCFFTFKHEFRLTDISKLIWVEHEGISKLAHPGKFQGELSEFYLQPTDSVDSAFNSLAEFKNIVKSQLGVRIFRNGFGIKPYGIDEKDWLNLSKGQTSGSSFYGLRPENVIGFISLDSRENRNLKEKTDREGFVDSEFSQNFFSLISFTTSHINDSLENTRRSYNEYKKKIAKETGNIQSVTESFTSLRNTSKRAYQLNEKAGEMKANLANYSRVIISIAESTSKIESKESKEFNDLLEELKKMLIYIEQMLNEVSQILDETKKLSKHADYLQPQIETLEMQLRDFSELAALGLTSEALSHELANIVDRLIEESERVYQKVQKEQFDNRSIKVFIEYIRSSAKSFNKQLSHISPTLKYVRENIDTLSVKDVLHETQEYYNDKFRGEISFNVHISGREFFMKMNKGKLIQIIDNIILNSEYWVKDKRNREPGYKPSITIEAKEPFLRIFDNADGIDPNIEQRIFQPFVTSKPKKIGRGLGLFIVQQLLETVGCEIILLNQKNQQGRRYIFQLNMASVIE